MKLRATGAVLGAVAWALVSSGSAAASSATGGAAPGDSSAVARVECVPTASAPCASSVSGLVKGGRMRLVGDGLAGVRAVVFRGARGRRDDVTTRAVHVGRRHVDAVVPARAQTGPLEIVPRVGRRIRAATKVSVAAVAAPRLAPDLSGYMFPIQGRHDVGQAATNNFGAERGHQGQDMFAACGTPLVAAASGVVRKAEAGHATAGNYAVIRDAATGQDHVYMHMNAPPLVREGESVTAGQPLGEVGDSGNAEGCHLHFEVWSAPGWYEGGEAIDPLPLVTAWDADH